jgi:hypothetical protein
MKLSTIALLFATTLACVSTPPKTPAPLAPTLHADPSDFTSEQYSQLTKAARQWSAIGTSPLDVSPDLDVTSLSNIRSHLHANHSLIRGVQSDHPAVQTIDEELADQHLRPLAFTASRDGQRFVFFILDRIPQSHFYHIALHEFGHVLGLPDIPTHDDVMSGVTDLVSEPVVWFTDNDGTLCRKARYCF